MVPKMQGGYQLCQEDRRSPFCTMAQAVALERSIPYRGRPSVRGEVMMMRGHVNGMVLAMATVAFAACGTSSTDLEDLLEGGVLATFRVSQEEFRVWVTNGETIQQIFDLRDGKSSASIPNGALLEGQGRADHNSPWSWHLDPIDIEMAELTVEICDGRPSLVDSLLDDYLSVGRFCPWGAELVEVQDLR